MNSINKLNLFSQSSSMQGVQQAKSVGGQSSSGINGGSASNNPFGASIFNGQTSGLNGMQIGDTVNTPAQAGKAAGVSRLLYNA